MARFCRLIGAIAVGMALASVGMNSWQIGALLIGIGMMGTQDHEFRSRADTKARGL